MNKNQKFAQWLELRIPYDVKARNLNVEKSCLEYLQKLKKLKIIDLGSGTGANCRYYFSKVSQEQDWAMVDENPEFLEIAIDKLNAWALQNRYESEVQDSKLVLRNQVQKITIQTIVGSILDLENLIDLEAFDLAVSNAIFDLFSEKQFQTLLECLKKYKLPLLSTINYTGMNFVPQTDEDARFIDYYHNYMKRPQYFGKAMGPECDSFMLETIKNTYTKVIQGESLWEISYKDPIFLQSILAFMEESIPEILEDTATQNELSIWLLEKKQMIVENRLNCNITHQDFYGYWE
jgi:SAM-dependent methyltransferase